MLKEGESASSVGIHRCDSDGRIDGGGEAEAVASLAKKRALGCLQLWT